MEIRVKLERTEKGKGERLERSEVKLPGKYWLLFGERKAVVKGWLPWKYGSEDPEEQAPLKMHNSGGEGRIWLDTIGGLTQDPGGKKGNQPPVEKPWFGKLDRRS